VKRFFERNRAALVPIIEGDRQALLGFLRCLFGSVVTGVYLFAETKVPGASIGGFLASKGLAIPTTLLPKAISLLPQLANASEMNVGVWGGLDISEGADIFGGFALGVAQGFRVPFIGEAYVGEEVSLGYDFTAGAWESPEWAAVAGDIPLSIGAVEAGLGVFVTRGDAVGFYLDFDLGPARSTGWGVEVDLSKSGMAAFWSAIMTGNFVNGCDVSRDGTKGRF
jgi:hypothetical protein